MIDIKIKKNKEKNVLVIRRIVQPTIEIGRQDCDRGICDGAEGL